MELIDNISHLLGDDLKQTIRLGARLCRGAGGQCRSCRVRQVATQLPDPDAGRRLQPRLGHQLQGRRGQAHLFRGGNQGLYVIDGSARDRKDQDQVCPQVLRRDEPPLRPGERQVRRSGQLREVDGGGEVKTKTRKRIPLIDNIWN